MQNQKALPLYIIFGGGHYGKKAFDFFHNKGHILAIDNNSQCLLDQCIESIGIIEFLNIISKNSSPSDFTEYFIQGDIEILLSILTHVIPIFLIPTAPIHIMKEIIVKSIERLGVSCSIEHADFVFDGRNIPDNLNTHIKSNSFYLSYNQFGQVCPDSCPGPLEYCPHQNLTKPQTVTKFVESVLSTQTAFIFESVQIINGLGGIAGYLIAESLTKIRSFAKFLHYGKNEMYIATTCNCHGVVDRISVIKK